MEGHKRAYLTSTDSVSEVGTSSSNFGVFSGMIPSLPSTIPSRRLVSVSLRYQVRSASGNTWIVGGSGRTPSGAPVGHEGYSCDLRSKDENVGILGQPPFRTNTRGRPIYSADMGRCRGRRIAVSWSYTGDMRGLSF